MGFPGRKNFKNNSNTSSSKIDEGKLNQMIRERAYYIWESKGKPQGQEKTIWLQAEKEILARVKK